MIRYRVNSHHNYKGKLLTMKSDVIRLYLRYERTVLEQIFRIGFVLLNFVPIFNKSQRTTRSIQINLSLVRNTL